MTAHRRAWAQRASIVLAAAIGTLGTLTTPAHAAEDPSVSAPSITMQAGGEATLTVKVANAASGSTLTIVVPTANGNPQVIDSDGCGGSTTLTCSNVTGTKEFDIRLRAAANAAPEGQQVVINGGRATLEANNTPPAKKAEANFQITIRGPVAQPKVVPVVSGVVKGSDGKVLGGAIVVIQDSAGHQYQTTTSSNGSFRFVSSDSKPISPGTINMGAQMDGYSNQVISAVGQAGQALTGVALTLPVKAAPTTSASPSEDPLPSFTAGPSTVPTEGVTEDAGIKTAGSTGSSFPWMPVLLGALLLLLGGGGIVYMLWRRKQDEAGEDEEDGPPGPQPVRPGAPRPRGYPATAMHGDAAPTMLGGGYGPGPGAPTAVVPPAGAVPRAMADAPTMLHSRPQADPYGAPSGPYGAAAPRPPQPGYGAGGHDYDHPSGRPGSGAGYGGGRGGSPAPYDAGGHDEYDNSRGYDRAGGYGGGSSGGYGGDEYGSRGGRGGDPYGEEGHGRSGHSYGGPDTGGYGAGGYGGEAGRRAEGGPPRGGRGGDGYGEGYGSRGGRGGEGYEPRGGYASSGGYDTAPGYDSGSGYEPTSGYESGGRPSGGRGSSGGYGSSGGGYGSGDYESGGYSRGGYEPDPRYGDRGADQGAGRRRGGDDRQRLDWLDD